VRFSRLIAVKYYDTVRYGRLAYIRLVVPSSAKVQRIDCGTHEYIVVDNKAFYVFYHYFGSAEEPSVVRPATESEALKARKILEERRIAHSARYIDSLVEVLEKS